MLSSLELQVSRPIFRTWLKDTVGLSLEDNRIVVGTPSAFVAEWLEKRMSALIESALSQVMGQRTEARFQILTEQPAAPPSMPIAAHSPQRKTRRRQPEAHRAATPPAAPGSTRSTR